MKWSVLTEEQRNLLVAERVMNWQPTQCDGELETGNGWQCSRCGLSGTWAGKDFDAFAGHLALPPRYSESLDVAWLIAEGHGHVVLDVVRRANGTLGHRAQFIAIGRVFSAEAATAPEALCLAALRLWGIEVEL